MSALYQHHIIIHYAPKTVKSPFNPSFKENSTLILHIKIWDNNPNQYWIADLINKNLSSDDNTQEIWGNFWVSPEADACPVFYCHKHLGETQLHMCCQYGGTGNEFPAIECWNINDPHIIVRSHVLKIHD